jgi:hypothetical protein
MKSINLLFMLLILLMNCVNPNGIEKDYKKTSDDSDLLYSLLTINKMKNLPLDKPSKPIKKCGIDCINFEKNYYFVDILPGQPNCIDNFSSGNGDGKPNIDEKGILRIPLSYNGGYPISNISVQLQNLDDNSIWIQNPTIYYPDLTSVSDFQYSCPKTYYENWNISSNVNCNSNVSSQCIGWKLIIPPNYRGKYKFQIIIYASIGAKILDYSL